MKKITSVIIASMMAAMPVFALADDTTDATAPEATEQVVDTATDATATDSSFAAEPEPVGTTEGGNPIYDITVLPDDTATGAESTPVQFDDDNFQLSMPAGWTEQELTEDQSAAGVVKVMSDPDVMLTITHKTSEATSIDELMTELSANTAYSDVRVTLINNVLFVAYSEVVNSTYTYCMPDAIHGGYIEFQFGGTVETLPDTAASILSTIAIADANTPSSITPYVANADEAEGTDAAADSTTTDDTATDSTATDSTATEDTTTEDTTTAE